MGVPGSAWGWPPWLMVLAVVATALLWVVVVIAAARLLRPPRPRGSGPSASGPLGTLDERLARGEIGVDEYRTRRRRLVDGH